MYIIQPNDSNRMKVRKLLKDLTADKIDDMISKMAKKTAVLTFPKLHISSTVHLKQLLKQMGITDIFDSRLADLSLISDGLQNLQHINPINVVPSPQNVEYYPDYKPSTIPITSLKPATPIYSPPSSTLEGGYTSQAIPPSNEYTQSIPLQTSSNSPFIPTTNHQQPEYSDVISNPNLSNPTVKQPTISTERYHKEHNLLGNAYQPNQPETQKEETFVLTRVGEEDGVQTTDLSKLSNRTKRSVKYKVESQFKQNSQPLRLKDLILRKRITKANPGKKIIRNRRQVPESIGLQTLDVIRNGPTGINPGLYADDILHKVDLVINEQGTEAAAATITYLRRSGTDVTFRADSPFIILIRHDPTRLPLFYGAVYEPVE